MVSSLIRACIRNPLITLVFAAVAVGLGARAWSTKTVDAIPDISENQTVVFTTWPGHSPQDVEDQITYPLSTALSTVDGVEEVRGLSGFGFSQVYVVFEDRLRFSSRGLVTDFYEARTRVLEKLASVQAEMPDGATPELGPDATALGQVFWYTLEGPQDLATKRSVQDFTVRFALQSVSGVAEVASVGGMVREYQIDVDPDRLRHFGASLMDVSRAVRRSNQDVGAKTIESAGMEVIVRGLGFVRSLADLEEVTIGHVGPGGFSPAVGMGGGGAGMAPSGMREGPLGERFGAGEGVIRRMDMAPEHTPVRVRDVAHVTLGPAFRRGALADERAERVGGVVVLRFGENPRDVIARVKEEVVRLNDPSSGALPEGMRVVPFYDRTQLIDETVETLDDALIHELWIAIAVVAFFLLHLRSSFAIGGTLPVAIAISFLAMHVLGIDSNIMSLTGIAIAIGTMIDMGIVMTENIYAHLVDDNGRRSVRDVVEDAAVEVGPALLTAVATTVVSFLPIFFLTAEEGKLFKPLAWTKTLALISAALVGILVVPVLCRFLLPQASTVRRGVRWGLLLVVPTLVGWLASQAEPFGLGPVGAFLLAALVTGLVVDRMLRETLRPVDQNPVSRAILRAYEPTLRWILAHKGLFMLAPLTILIAGLLAGLGGRVFTAPAAAVAGDGVEEIRPLAWLDDTFPGLGQEFMPPLDEGSLLYMPSLLPAAGLTEVLDVMKRQNARMMEVPEVAKVMGKLGRAESALDPAPVGMIETVVILHPPSTWREGKRKSDLVDELMTKVHTPGASEGAGAWLQPIETRIVMLNSGIRAPLALKLIGSPEGPDGEALDSKDAVALLESVASRMRDQLGEVPGVAGASIENLGGKPYLEYDIDREILGHFGLTLGDVTDAVATAVGGMEVSRTLEGRERYGIRVAYPRERRDSLEALGDIQVRGSGGQLVPIRQVAELREVIGPAAIKTEDGRLRLHVTFAASGADEGTVMRRAMEAVQSWRNAEMAAGRLDPVPTGISIEPAGRYESQIRARERFALLIPICLGVIVFLLYLNFGRWGVTLNVFAAVPVVAAGGLLLLAWYPELKDVLYELGLWDAPSAGPVYLTVAVVVGFIALLGIATDDGVVMATYLEQTFRRLKPESVDEVRDAVVAAGLRRIRPCLMTTFTTILALYPILSSTGRGSDVAQPMAIPAVGGMMVSVLALFIVPCVYCWARERELRAGGITNQEH